MDSLALHEVSQFVVFKGERRHAVVANERIGEHHELASIGGVGQRLGIAGHGGVEHHFACHRPFVAERFAVELCAVIQKEGYFTHCIFGMGLTYLFICSSYQSM